MKRSKQSAPTAYDLLRFALIQAGAQCLAHDELTRAEPCEMICWNLNGVTFYVQHWKRSGGFDAYLPQREFNTLNAIAEVLTACGVKESGVRK